MSSSVEKHLVLFHCKEITIWDVVSQVNTMHEADAADRESLEILRNITDPSDQAESDVLTALKNLVPEHDQGKFGNLLIEHWLEYLKSRKISSAEFVKN